MASKIKVFLSSTAKDLDEYRQAVLKLVDGSSHYECIHMENWGARDGTADHFCIEKVHECDVFVGVLGHYYGGIPEGHDKSYTEREYDAAVTEGKRRLMFLAPDAGFTLKSKLHEPEWKWDKQHAFRDRVAKDRMPDWFRQPDELASKVLSALPEEVQTVPPPCREPCYQAVPFIPKDWTGRRTEMDDLDAWLRAGEDPMCCLVAMGGMGKSTLAHKWATERVEPERDGLGLEGIYQWSFYEGEVSFDRFLEHLAAYLGVSADRDPVTDTTQFFRGHRVLLILDGLERLLRYYASVDAALLPEKDASELAEHERRCSEPRVARLLGNLADSSSTKTLVTTRLNPEELDGRGGCRVMELEGLAPPDAVAFLRAHGILGTDRELERAASRYGFHPFSLDRLAGKLKNDLTAPNDIRQAPQYDASLDLTRRRADILQQAYETLPTLTGKLLGCLAAVRGKANLTMARAVFENWTDEKLSTALQRLEEDRWLTWDRSNGALSFHPLTRRYAYERLTGKASAHNRLAEHFLGHVSSSDRDVACLEDLAPVIELYHHTVSAGRYDEACRLFRDRIADQLYYRFGAYQTCIELLRALFPDGEDCPPRLKDVGAQAWALNEIANSHAISGQPRRAVKLIEMAVATYGQRAGKESLAIGLASLASPQIAFGLLADAEGNLRRSIQLCRDTLYEWGEAVGHQDLGWLLAYRGEFEAAEHELATALAILEQRREVQVQTVAWSHRALSNLLASDPTSALGAARRARELADETARMQSPLERDFIRAEWLLGWANVALAEEAPEHRGKLLAEADSHLAEALTRCRRINMVDHEPDILLARARWHQFRAEGDAARETAAEAVDIGDRCEYRLVQADCHNFLARLALDTGEREEAAREAQIACERAWCDGPPHCYKPALDEAERMLRELGTVPVVPPSP